MLNKVFLFIRHLGLGRRHHCSVGFETISGGLEGRLSTLGGGAGSLVVPVAAASVAAPVTATSAAGADWLGDKGFDRK